MKKRISAVMAFLFIAVLCTAQSPVAKNAPAMLSIRGFGFETGMSEIYVAVGRQMMSIELRAYEPGAIIRMPAGGSLLRFFTPPPAPKDVAMTLEQRMKAPVAQWIPVASVEVPPSRHDLILGFFLQQPNAQGERYRIMVIENDVVSYPVGSMRIINLSPFELAFNLGGEQATLRPGERTVKQPVVDRKHRTYLQMAAHQPNQDWEMFHRGVASVLPSRRSTFFVIHSASYLAKFEKQSLLPGSATANASMIVIPWSDQPAS